MFTVVVAGRALWQRWVEQNAQEGDRDRKCCIDGVGLPHQALVSDRLTFGMQAE